MNKFRFRFASVLRYREILEESKKRDFGVAMSHLHHQESALRAIDASISGHANDTKEHSKGAVSVRDLQSRYNFARKLDLDRERQKEQIVNAQHKVEKRRSQLVEATKQKKIFERLEERDRDIHSREVLKEEQSLSDEIATQNHARKSYE